MKLEAKKKNWIDNGAEDYLPAPSPPFIYATKMFRNSFNRGHRVSLCEMSTYYNTFVIIKEIFKM